MENTISVSEGATYEYLRHGLVLLVVGGLLCILHPLLLIPFAITGIALMSAQSGIEIDLENQRIRKYKSILKFIKKGDKWIDLQNMQLVLLRYNANAGGKQEPQSVVVVAPYILPEPRTAKTFDMFFIDDTESVTEFNQFMKYSLASKVLKALEKIEHLNIKDQFGERLAKSRRRR